MDDLKKMMEEAVADILCKELGPQVLHQDVADVDDAVIAEHDVFRQEMLPVAAKIVTAVNALPELIAVKAERDRAQRACEQMGQRITALENLLTLCADQFHVLRRLAEGGQIHKIEAGNKRVRISLSKAVASECEISEAKVRAALNQEAGS